MKNFSVLILLAASSITASPLISEESILEPYSGPYRAIVVRVIDGDTIVVDVQLWPGLTARYSVRERGIDAPEIRRVGCQAELEWGLEAKAQIEKLFPPGTVVRLDDVELGSFSGRVIADVRRLLPSQQFRTLKTELLTRQLAVEWTEDQSDVPWCLLAETRANN